MSKSITVDDAKRLIKLAREVDGKATPGPWAWSPFAEKSNSYAIGVAVKKDGTQLCGRIETDTWDEEKGVYVDDILYKGEIGDMEGSVVNYGDPDGICLWRASYGALLEYLREWIENDKKDCHGIGRLEAIALSPLISWADANHPNWRSPR